MTAAILLASAMATAIGAHLLSGSWRCRKCDGTGGALWAVFHLHRRRRA
jgi:hypothetical protein